MSKRSGRERTDTTVSEVSRLGTISPGTRTETRAETRISPPNLDRDRDPRTVGSSRPCEEVVLYQTIHDHIPLCLGVPYTDTKVQLGSGSHSFSRSRSRKPLLMVHSREYGGTSPLCIRGLFDLCILGHSNHLRWFQTPDFFTIL